MKIFISASCCTFLFAGALSAQTILDRFSLNVGGGVDETLFTTKNNLAGGWNVQVGGGYNFTPHLGMMLNIEYDRLRISTNALNILGTPQGYPGGHVTNEAVTFDPVWHFLRPKGNWDVYVTGGGGAYQRYQVLTRPTVATATGSDAFFGFNTPGYPASETNLSYTVVKPGLDVGAGVAYQIRWHLKLYAEARYNHVFMGDMGHMDWVPISVGVRW